MSDNVTPLHTARRAPTAEIRLASDVPLREFEDVLRSAGLTLLPDAGRLIVARVPHFIRRQPKP